MNRSDHIKKAEQILTDSEAHCMEVAALMDTDVSDRDLNKIREWIDLNIRLAEGHMHMAELLPYTSEDIYGKGV